MNMNQITLPCRDYTASVNFYRTLGFRQIVDSPPRYARFECDNGSTFSLHLTPDMPQSPSGWVIYFETDALDVRVAALIARGIGFTSLPRDEPWLWREARLKDPAGNEICFFTAGENRRFPPWRMADDAGIEPDAGT